jgi:hypothetical protein
MKRATPDSSEGEERNGDEPVLTPPVTEDIEVLRSELAMLQGQVESQSTPNC